MKALIKIAGIYGDIKAKMSGVASPNTSRLKQLANQQADALRLRAPGAVINSSRSLVGRASGLYRKAGAK